MRPPICAVCRRRFDPGGPSGRGGAGLVRFADYRPLPDGMPGHPAGTEWFCRRHHRAARSLRDRSLPDALALIRRRRWRRALWPLGLVVVVLLASASAWNTVGPLELDDIDAGYAGRVAVGRHGGREIGAKGALFVRGRIETETRPSRNPLRVAWEQLRYNAWTRGYDLVVWLEPASGDPARRRFALYQSGRTVFLRSEFQGRNRVLAAEFTATELERDLEPYLTAVAGGEPEP